MQMMNKEIKYEKYKDSGVEWIEAVPTHWEVKKFKRVFYEIKKRTNPSLNCGSISFGKVVYKDDEKIPESTKKSYQVVLKGDFLVNPLNLNYDLISLRIALSDIDVVVSSGYIVLGNSAKLDKTYYKYFLHRFDVAFMKLLGSGVRQTLNWNDIANCDLIFPPLPEQTAIAAFLDRKTALIDQAIDIKQKQIELLKERRQILIHKAVTQGLNPNVKMKDSGVEWIGEIPVGWEVKRLKYFFNDKKSKFIDGDWIESKDINGEDYRYLTTGNIGEGFYKEQGEGYISSVTFKKLNCTEAVPGDLLICRLSLPLGRTCICPKLNLPIVLSVDVVIARMDSIYNRDYYNYVMNTVKYKEHTELVSRGSIMSRISRNILGNIYFQIPTTQEQIEIVRHLDNKTEKIHNIISLKEQEIEKLKEYKATLINSAVTGKIKVC